MPNLHPSRAVPIVLQLLGWMLLLAFAATPARGQSTADSGTIDPPGRVGSLSLLAGPVTMTDLNTGSREEALLNWPVTGGWRIETGRTARAEVRIGSSALRLDDETTVDFVRLDDSFMQIAVLRGSLSLRIRNREVLDELELLTQRERIVFDETGSFRVDVDRPAGLTALTAFAGQARIASGGSVFVVGAGQRGEVTAPPAVRFQIVAAVADRFDDWAAARDARDEAIRSASYVSRETTGVELLDDYGDWRTVEEYGAVWFPRGVAATWAPYRYGRWTWIGPWGWTWIDEAPWGFAPLHYGRWAVVGGLWGWIPGGVVPRPVYAPALVAWYSTPGISVGIGAPVGWFPLGPREPYVPAFRHSPRYLRVINVQHVTNIEQVTIVQAPKYVHRHPDRSTWVPDDRFGRPEPVHRGQRPPPSEWRQYIARPQPPANVPNTKRRQAADGGGTIQPAMTPATADGPRPAVRPPQVVPRAGDVPRLPEAPRGVEMPQPRPAQPAPARPEPSTGGRSEFPSTPRTGEVPRSFDRSGATDVPRASPVQPPPARSEPTAGRGELPPAPQDGRRLAPRATMPSGQRSPGFQPVPGQQPPAATTPRGPPSAVEAPATRGRGEAGAYPRGGQRQAPREAAPAGSAPSTPAPQSVPPAAPAPAPRDANPQQPAARPAPPPRADTGAEPGGQRPGRVPSPQMAR